MIAAADHVDRELLARFGKAVADDLMTLAVLHDRELDSERVAQIRETVFPEGVALVLESRRGLEALELMRAAVARLPASGDAAGLDNLAADYADIYLTYKLRASPCESVWLDEDGLTLQAPMFEVREWYRRHGLAAENWRERSDDHLVLQLQFLAHLLGGSQRVDPGEVAQFLDRHLLLWIDDFAGRVAARCATPFYAALAVLTAAYADELRDLLVAILDEPRPDPELIRQEILERREGATRAAGTLEVPVTSIPATTPSW